MTGMTHWEDFRDGKLKRRDELIAEFKAPEALVPTPEQMNDVTEYIETMKILTEDEIEITNSTIEQIQSTILEKRWTATQTIRAFIHRATLAQQLTNCLTEIRFEEALKEAEAQDSYFSQTGKLVGPFHGIAVSLKDNIKVEGLATSMGFVALAEKIEQEDAALVKLLKSLGGCIICKTNTSAGMMYSETTNKLWGRTYNPSARQYLNCGGSSGGEAVLAAMKGSCVGFGSDIGGSVRHPAALCGVYSLKPSFGRIPSFGTASGQPGQESIKSIYGPLSYWLENVEYSFKAIVDSEPYKSIDANCIPLKFRKQILDNSPLTVGFLDTDGTSTATPPVLRGLEIVRKALESSNHQTVDWPDIYLTEIKNAIYPFYDANGYKSIKALIEASGEPVDPLLSKWFPTARDMPVSELWSLQVKRSELCQKYLKLWNTFSDKPLDALIVPVSPFPGCPLDGVVTLPFTAIWNGLDYCGSTIPVTRCDTKQDVPLDKTNFISKVDEHVHETYKHRLNEFQGGVVSLQVICGKLQEEKCLAITNYLKQLLK
ncbi:unnamed protein product [Kuraishia capsulata CBS 1993]|uniref:Amidase domain-containing protein n=1 Tax=Kuraishia capsulata CBS 1993 TaxID=1382522 RepID=W6MJ61_9ASCO|nr:uncharacterized protein KUCA_T00002247001 [Kuraishia capsulata CBS 1993]CDK26276.1 unnamed protein product [Kuraishia capsulata CBS 1993]